MRHLTLLTVVLLGFLAGPSVASASSGFLSVPGPDGREERFVVDLGNMQCAILPDGLAFVMTEADAGQSAAKGLAALIDGPIVVSRRDDTSTTARCVVRLDFVDANAQALPRGRSTLPGKVNLYLGRDQRRWRPDVRRFAEVVYKGLWPGVDLVLRADNQGLTYELLCEDPQSLQAAGIRMSGGTVLAAKSGGEGVSTTLGDLLVSPGFGAAPRGRIWCNTPAGDSAGANGALTASATSGASSVLWSTYLGGSSGDAMRAVASDDAGRVFVTGFTNSVDYPVTPGAFQAEKESNEDAVVTVLDGDTGYPLWSTYLGGDNLDEGWALTALPNGNLIVAGKTWSTNFPTTPGAMDSTREAPEAAFVAEMDVATGHLVWCTLLDGAHARAVAATTDGAIVTAGDTYLGYLPTTGGAFDQSFNGGSGDTFLARISGQGRNLDWCTYLGSSANEQLLAMKLDGEDRPIVAGFTGGGDSPGFPVTAQAYDPTFAGGDWDGFVSKLSADGHSLIWSTYLGGESNDWINGMALRSDGSIVLSGPTASTRYPVTLNAYQTDRDGTLDGMVSTLSADGAALIQSTYLGGGGRDVAMGVSSSPTGTIVVSGITSGPTFPGPLSQDQHAVNTNYGTSDAFLAEMSLSGEALLNSRVIGGTDMEQVVYHCWTPQRTIVMAGSTMSADFPVTAGCFDGALSGGDDIFVLKIGSFITPVFLGAFEASRVPAGALVHWEIGAGSTASRMSLCRETGPGTRETLAQWELVGPGETQFVDRSAPQGEANYWLQVTDGEQEKWYGPAHLEAAAAPAQLTLAPNFPNPFNPRTTVRFDLPRAGAVSLGVYDLRGRMVRTLCEGAIAAGRHDAAWDGLDRRGAPVPSGTYVLRLKTDSGTVSRKIALGR